MIFCLSLSPKKVFSICSRSVQLFPILQCSKLTRIGCSQKHLMHLKVIQQMSKVPRSVGIHPLSDENFDHALMVGASSHSQITEADRDDEGKINPLAGMGLSDEQYALILQNLVNSESFPGVEGGAVSSLIEKRGLDDASDGRDGKRGRFEVIE